jgi:3-phosphoshikimate 1-carboxyvinyltransferase
MTLQWLDAQQIRYGRDGYRSFRIYGRQAFGAFERQIPADWSSATFPICAAAVTDSDVVIRGVDARDVQGDKAVAAYLSAMGADMTECTDGLRVRGARLRGAALDLNATPDALPALAVVACCAQGATRIYNVAQARVKETDRIRVMAAELKKMGARIEELPDGLAIHQSALAGAAVQGHRDHRVVMALSIAGLAAEGTTTVDTAEAVAVTYPQYVSSMQALGARLRTI